MFYNEDAATERFAKYVKCIVDCHLEPNIDVHITSLEAIRIPDDLDSVTWLELPPREQKMSRFGGIIGTVIPYKHLESKVLLLLSIQAIRSMSTNKYWLVYFSIIHYVSQRFAKK